MSHLCVGFNALCRDWLTKQHSCMCRHDQHLTAMWSWLSWAAGCVSAAVALLSLGSAAAWGLLSAAPNTQVSVLLHVRSCLYVG
jgi:hypothetical protein